MNNTLFSENISISRSYILKLVSSAAIATFVLMTIYEYTKQLIFPSILIWESHAVTITFSTILASFASYFAIRKINILHEQIVTEVKEREKIEKHLRELTTNLEEIVNKRTIHLEKLNKELKNEIYTRIKIEAELKRSEERYVSLFRKSPVGLFEYNPDLMITEMNDRFVELIKSSRAELFNFDINTIIDNQVLPALLEVFQGREGYYKGPYFSTISNHLLFAILRTAPLLNSSGKIIGGIGIVEDITALSKKEEELISAKKNAEKSEKLKTEFLSQISHEIRTPLHSISSFTQLIKEKLNSHADDETNDYFHYISNSCNRVVRTIDLIVNMSEIQVGSYKYVPTSFNFIKDLIIPIIGHYKIYTDSKNLALVFIEEINNIIIKADLYSLQQVFVNLLDNAIKFTNEGGIIIRVARDEQNIIVQVEDSGIGISKEYLQNLFKPFTQEDTGYSRKYEGNGLGLALVKEYCNINSAIISVTSIKGKGSVFTVSIPID